MKSMMNSDVFDRNHYKTRKNDQKHVPRDVSGVKPDKEAPAPTP